MTDPKELIYTWKAFNGDGPTAEIAAPEKVEGADEEEQPFLTEEQQAELDAKLKSRSEAAKQVREKAAADEKAALEAASKQRSEEDKEFDEVPEPIKKKFRQLEAKLKIVDEVAELKELKPLLRAAATREAWDLFEAKRGALQTQFPEVKDDELWIRCIEQAVSESSDDFEGVVRDVVTDARAIKNKPKPKPEPTREPAPGEPRMPAARKPRFDLNERIRQIQEGKR